MGPIALFDKSFLQSLSLDEAVWFDHFFIANIAPLFFVETLADLEKAVKQGRSPEDAVGVIAEKTPVMRGAPSASHLFMGISELLGNRVPMTGQIPVAGGHFVKSGPKRGVVFKGLPEAEAFARWQQGEFLTVERKFARAWREALASIDLTAIAEGLRKVGINATTCRSLIEAHAIAVQVVSDRDKPFDRIKMAITAVAAPPHLHYAIIERWITAGKPALIEYAPFVAHILTVELFFQIALASHLIGTERPSNLADIAYLFYLPLCMLFISGDLLHQRCAPLFLRPDQQFVWAPDMKAELRRINLEFVTLPEATKEKGIMSFARVPPGDGSFLLPGLWDHHFPGYRDRLATEGVFNPVRDERVAAELRAMSEGAPLSTDEMDFDPQNADSLVIERRLAKRRGNWWQLPKDLQVDED
jgi:hypothetical protein